MFDYYFRLKSLKCFAKMLFSDSLCFYVQDIKRIFFKMHTLYRYSVERIVVKYFLFIDCDKRNNSDTAIKCRFRQHLRLFFQKRHTDKIQTFHISTQKRGNRLNLNFSPQNIQKYFIRYVISLIRTTGRAKILMRESNLVTFLLIKY